MDNASKALIMAGAILISVALVSLGVYLFNMASGLTGDAENELTSSKIETQNGKFEKYAGTNVKGPEVKSLIRAVGAFNANDIFPADITVTLDSASGTTANLANSVDDRDYYTVEMTSYDAENGTLTAITITTTTDN